VGLVTGLVLAALGALGGVGLLLVIAGWRGVEVVDVKRSASPMSVAFDRVLLRSTAAIGLAVVALFLSHWPVLAAAAAAAGWLTPTLMSARGQHERELALVEGIATWTEQIRDTLAAANGLEHALAATAHLAPRPIAGAVERLAARFDYERLPDALRRFADEVDHPLADFVVAALIIATEKEARDLGALLTQLADSARDEARMRTRVWVSRARTRSAVRIIVGVVALFVVGLLLADREYLSPYDSTAGQFVLIVVIGMFVTSFVAMARIGRMTIPERFIARRDHTEPLLERAWR